MNLLLIVWTLAALQAERATAPSFRGKGDGKLVVFEVCRSGEPASPEKARPGEIYREEKSRVAVRSEISLRRFPLGEYLLRARITDETTGEVAERESPFTVRGR